jgi:hypothetical protein
MIAQRASIINLDQINKIPYDPRKIEQFLQQTHPESIITSNTLPKINQKNVKLAGTAHPNSGIVYDQKGFPIFDDIAVYDTKISFDLVKKYDPSKVDLSTQQAKKTVSDAHMRAATRDLREKINKGIIDRNQFTQKQLEAIYSGKGQIPEFTWHHHQDTGRMQLIREEIHNKTGHVGGMNLWYKK